VEKGNICFFACQEFLDLMMIAVQTLLVVLILGGLAFYLTCAFFTYQFFREGKGSHDPEAGNGDRARSNSPNSPSLPPVSILVPVRGLDAGALENWSSLCTQNYSDFEVLFGVVDLDDPAIPVIQELADQFSPIVRLFTGLKPRGINHKDSSLSYLLEEARYDWIIFVDSDIRVHRDYIHTVTAPLKNPQVGMVTCAYIGYHPKSVGAAIASFGRCFDFIPSLLIARVLDGGLRCAIGTTIATRRDALANYGGLHMNRIGSDYNLGKRAAQSGYIVELSRYVLESDTGTERVGEVFQRELRWARTIRFNRGLQYYTMIFCYGTVFCLPLLLLTGFANWAIALTILTYLIRYMQVCLSIIQMKAPNLFRWLWALPLRDLLSFLIWVIGCYGQQVYWRGRKLQVYEDGLIVQLEGDLT
jgi:ceramide glucosyltransferase